MKRLATAIGLAAALAACQTTGQDDSASKALMAVPPDYRAQIAKHFHDTLKDPYSVRSAEITAPTEQFVGLINGGTRPAVCIRFNAKNSFGAYVGRRSHVAWFANGKLQNVVEEYQFACGNDTVYQPFPELEIDSKAAAPSKPTR